MLLPGRKDEDTADDTIDIPKRTSPAQGKQRLYEQLFIELSLYRKGVQNTERVVVTAVSHSDVIHL